MKGKVDLQMYRISSNRHRPRIVATQPEALEQNKRCPRIVAVASKHGTHTHMQMITDNSHHASARTVCVVRVIATADSRTERLRVLLTGSSNCHRLTRTYLIQLSLMSPGFPKK